MLHIAITVNTIKAVTLIRATKSDSFKVFMILFFKFRSLYSTFKLYKVLMFPFKPFQDLINKDSFILLQIATSFIQLEHCNAVNVRSNCFEMSKNLCLFVVLSKDRNKILICKLFFNFFLILRFVLFRANVFTSLLITLCLYKVFQSVCSPLLTLQIYGGCCVICNLL